MNKNEIYEIEIEDMGTDGEGIGHIAETKSVDNRGIAVFVKDTVVGDVVRIKIVKAKKNYAYGRLEEIITPSPYRVEAKCAKARSCGGCTLMHMSYEKQLEYKWNKVRNCLERIGGVEAVGTIMEPICGMEEPYYYRNKMQFPVGLNKDGQVQIGFYAGRTHSIIDLNRCEIGHPVNNRMLQELRIWLQKWQNQTGDFNYDEERHQGLVRHILTRVGFTTGQVMVCLVINGTDLPSNCKEEFVMALQRGVEKYNESSNENLTLESVSININREKTNRILGDTCRTLDGTPYITDYIGEIQFRISPLSFYQVNPVQTKVLYDKAVEYADLSGEEIVWDMYCGIGTISLCLAQKAKKVYGVEIVPQAIEDAKKNAEINHLENTEFFCGKAEEVVPEFYQSGDNMGKHPDVVVVDPPRKGCDEVLLQTIVEMAPKRLVYVSCDPATLARDVKRLGEMGYGLVKVGVVDQFCHSGHVETVVLLSQQHADDFIDIELDLEEFDLTSAESKASYREIKEYIFKKYGTKVSTLYIAQTKRKCGIELGINYNPSKKENARVPICPLEKEKMILDALTHFQMI